MTDTATTPAIESLVRRLRKRQKEFFSLRWKIQTPEKNAALQECQEMESQVIAIQLKKPSQIGMLAEWMIGLQRKFFQTRGPIARREAVDAERRVDYELERLAGVNQRDLFSGES